MSFSRYAIAFHSLEEARSYLDELMHRRAQSDGRLLYLERAFADWEAERDELEQMIDDIKLCLTADSASRGCGDG